jgi:BirA family biotin operon repressor/biotin-[acetyl-CoA-carboxylase] ligase
MPSRSVLRLAEIDSTNRYALKNLEYFPDRQIIVADRQTAGYGRLGRRWVAGLPGNLCMSMVLKPSVVLSPASAYPCLTLYLSVILSRQIEEYDIGAEIKWPNDIMVNGRKLSGILGEARYLGSKLCGYVLGLGVNLNMGQEHLRTIDQPATSLSLLTGTRIEVDGFLDRLLDIFFYNYEEFLQEGFPAIKRDYIAKCSFLGNPVEVRTSSARYAGIARTVTDQGGLEIETGAGAPVVLNAGDLISLRTAGG